MKLYATVTSERASKGQGGNERLVFHVTGEDRENDIAVITVFPWSNTLDDGIPHICLNVRKDIGLSVDRYIKGERQKGECKCYRIGLHDQNGVDCECDCHSE